jgi:hypothetical protein
MQRRWQSCAEAEYALTPQMPVGWPLCCGRIRYFSVSCGALCKAFHSGKRLSDALPTLVKRTDAGGVG